MNTYEGIKKTVQVSIFVVELLSSGGNNLMASNLVEDGSNATKKIHRYILTHLLLHEPFPAIALSSPYSQKLGVSSKKNGIFWEFFPKWRGGGSSQFPNLLYNYQVIFGMPNSS